MSEQASAVVEVGSVESVPRFCQLLSSTACVLRLCLGSLDNELVWGLYALTLSSLKTMSPPLHLPSVYRFLELTSL